MDEPEEFFRKGGKQPKYTDPDKFSLEIHHGGKLIKGGGIDEYVGREGVFLDHVDGDKMSWIELVRIMVAAMPKSRNMPLYVVRQQPVSQPCMPMNTVDNEIPFVQEIHVAQSLNWDGLFIDWNDDNLDTFKRQEENSSRNQWQLGDLPTEVGNEAFEVQYEGQNDNEVEEEQDEDEEDPLDMDFIDSDYEQIGKAEEIEIDNNMFEENIDNPIEEEPEEMVSSKKKKTKVVPNYRQWRRESMLRNPSFDIGMHFPNKSQFKEAVIHYGCKLGRKIWFKKNDKNRVRAACEEGCPFVIYASRIDESPTLVIKTMNLEHDCSVDQKLFWMNSTFMAEKYFNELRADPDWSVKGFTAAIQRDFGLEPSSQQIYRAGKKACTLNKCDFVDQFHKLHDYCEKLKKANPGSTVVLKTKMDGDQRRFHRLYICLDACKRGFIEGCMPLIGMDGAFIKGPHPGQLLAAVGSDGNNGMFPIAYAIVEIENKETWVWFIQHLIRDLRIENGHAYAFISDKQKGLSIAIAELIPNAEHRHCVRHFYNNFKGSHPGLTLKQILWDAARETTIPWWKCQMERIKMESEAAWKWLHPKPAQHWMKARDKPILQMLESIRTNLMVRMANRRVAAFKWKKSVGPRIEKIVEKNKVESGYCIPILSGDMKYQVTNMEGGQYAVDLGTRSCSCMRWDLCGIPCSHAITCISRRRQDPFDYVDECYKKAAYLKSYNPIISPMPSIDQWQRHDPNPLLPPLYKKQVGRPKKKRVREQGEPPAATSGNRLRKWVYDRFKCSKCGKDGHNKKTCGTSSTNAATKQVARGGHNRTTTAQSHTSIPTVGSQPPLSQPSSSNQGTTPQTQQKRLESLAKRGRPWRV
ncbi:unnamed protein product [Prunus armeniaca]